MEKLTALPPQYKVLLTLAVAGVIVGIGWYYFIGDYDEQITAMQGKTRMLQKEYNSLKVFEDKKKLKELEEAAEAQKKKQKENEDLLPNEEEIPEFIELIKALADNTGLEIKRFELKEIEPEDYYEEIPIKMEVEGSFKELLEFMQSLAQDYDKSPEKKIRIVNLKELHIEKLPMDISKLEHLLNDEDLDIELATFLQKKQTKDNKLTEAEKDYIAIKKWQAANELSLLKAKFVAYTFTYTGKLMPEELRQKKLKAAQTKKKRKKKY